jgi:anaerobic ribonucleoside-triphosphate reductase
MQSKNTSQNERVEYIPSKASEKNNTKRTKCEIYSRCVGYLRPVRQWNPGKRQEFADRKVYVHKKETKIDENTEKNTGE